MSKLQSEIDDAFDNFFDQITLPPPRTTKAADISALSKEVLRVVGQHRDGVTANALTDETGVGLAPMFEELRDLMACNLLLRIVRDDDQLPIYVLPGSGRRRRR